jgi:hypothetical protein
VIFEESLRDAALYVANQYGALKLELEKILKWPIEFRPTVVLIRTRPQFIQIAGTDLIVGFAVPERNLIVIDYSQMSSAPFNLEAVLKHELCHLLLHRYIRRDNLPRWFDEGVCQWASDGITEVIMESKNTVFHHAIISGRQLRMKDLAVRFPADKRSMQLAYAQSQSFLDFISREFGRSGVLNLLESLRQDIDIDTAVEHNFAIPLDQLERQWINHLTKNTWLTFLTIYIYEIVFFLGALALIAGFIRYMFKKRAYQDEQEEEEN